MSYKNGLVQSQRSQKFYQLVGVGSDGLQPKTGRAAMPGQIDCKNALACQPAHSSRPDSLAATGAMQQNNRGLFFLARITQ
jgi:hypothetical protein